MQLIICLKMDLALNNLQRLICHKTQQTKKDLQKNVAGLRVSNDKEEKKKPIHGNITREILLADYFQKEDLLLDNLFLLISIRSSSHQIPQA